jgi:hypothetical protein
MAASLEIARWRPTHLKRRPPPHGGGFFVDKTAVFRFRERSKSWLAASRIMSFGAVLPSLLTLMNVRKLIGTTLGQSLTVLFTDQ